MGRRQRIGILTSGGDCPGLNAVIRSVFRAADQLNFDVVGFRKGYEGLVDPVVYMPLNRKNTSQIFNRGGTILGSTNRGRFAATVGVANRVELPAELLEGVRTTFEQLELSGLICVGGDGSLAVAQQFHEAGLPVVGVPKTIDNDLSSTAFTFGFDSAVACATDALDRLHTTASSHDRVMVLEVMGRHTGWIALNAAIAGGAGVALIPEIPWNFENVCRIILDRERNKDLRFTLVVVAEGAHLPDGDLVTRENARDDRQTRLGGIGEIVARNIESRLQRETRVVVLGHLQRGGNPTAFDRILATQLGTHAVRLIRDGRFGEMVCYHPPRITSVPIIQAVNALKSVHPDDALVQTARALGISFGDTANVDTPFVSLAAEPAA
jgi:6-phosphofructokinase 1